MKIKLNHLSPKYFSNSLRDLEENRQKRLDKVDDLLYNIRTGGKDRNKKMNYIEVGLYDLNPNPEAKLSIDTTLASLKEIDTFVKKANEKTGRDAFIAGGSVRDCLLGYEPRDIDVFLPLQPEEDKDDEAVYYSEIFRSVARPDVPFNVAIKAEPKTFFGTYDDNELAAYTLYHELIERLPPPQIISREGSVEDIINSFDYDLVKAYYKDEKFFVAETIPEIVNKGRIKVETLKARDRIYNWRKRTGHKISVRCLEKPEPVKTTASTLNWLSTAGTRANWVVMPQVIGEPARMMEI